MVTVSEEGVRLDRVLERREQIRSLVSAHGASNPRVIGSVARGTERRSDVDLRVDVIRGTTVFMLDVRDGDRSPALPGPELDQR